MLRLCQNSTFDLVILILNNIIFPDIGIGTRRERMEKWLQFIAEIKRLYDRPIIAFCGWMTGDPVLDTLHVTDATAAGANVFFLMPAAASDIIGAIEKCLAVLPEAEARSE